MTFVPAGLAALVTVYCLACVVRPGWRDHQGRVELDLGHAVMGATTLVLLLGVLPSGWAPGLLVLFGGAMAGCAVRSVQRVVGRAGYLRLGALCAAMLPMLVPTSATAAPQVMAAADRPHQMTAMAVSPAMSSPAGRVVDLLLIAALLVLAAGRLAGASRADQTLHCRLHTLCEVAMAATTGCMLGVML